MEINEVYTDSSNPSYPCALEARWSIYSVVFPTPIVINLVLCVCRVMLANGSRVAFHDGQGSIHWVLPSRLDAVESVFAMTVHKSQGSELDHVCLVSPDRAVAVLTRELLYTGIMRAKTN